MHTLAHIDLHGLPIHVTCAAYFPLHNTCGYAHCIEAWYCRVAKTLCTPPEPRPKPEPGLSWPEAELSAQA
jgi:hypothetical protein